MHCHTGNEKVVVNIIMPSINYHAESTLQGALLVPSCL